MIKNIASFMLVLVFILSGITISFASQTSLPDKSNEIKLVSLDTTRIDHAKEKGMRSKFGVLQIPFIKNESQIKDSSVKYYANTLQGTVFITDAGITYSIRRKNITDESSKGWIIRESLLNAQRIQAEGITASETNVSYFKGKDKSNWKSNIPTYQEVSLGEVYDSIKLNLKAYGKKVEKIFIVEKGGNPENITVNLEGASGLMVNGNGELEIDTEMGTLKMTAPIAYQEINGKKVNIEVAYNIHTDTVNGHDSRVYGFKIGDYDKNYPLVIDPLLASTFIGGSDDDAANSITLDSSGNVFVAGYTYSFANDIFVAKLDSTLTELLKYTFIGGSDYESVSALALDSSGNVFITGYTYSYDFPTTQGAYDTTCGTDGNCNYDPYGFGSYGDVFVTKLDNDLITLMASTFIGGSDDESASALALDSSGNVFITGYTYSYDFPTTQGAYDTTCGTDGNCNYNPYGFGSYGDVFVTKLDNDLITLMASTFIGGSDDESASALALDSSGNVFIAGSTYSSSDDALDRYPTTQGAYNEDYRDIFVSKLDNTLTNLLASTFIGGTSGNSVSSIALDSSKNIFITGYTMSSDYPTTIGAYDRKCGTDGDCNGWYGDVFVSKLNNRLSKPLLASTFIGGSDDESASALALDSSGNVFITGYTYSYDYPTKNAYDNTCGMDGYCDYDSNMGYSHSDVFVSKLNNALTSLLASTFIGGSSDEGAFALTPDSSGNIFIAGYTYSNDYPTTQGAYDDTCGTDDYPCDGFYMDAFVSKLPPIFYTLTLTKTGTGTGTVTSSDGGITCGTGGTDCKEKYPKGTVVTLTAAADPDSTITGWTGCTASSDKTTCTVAMTAAKTATVTFTTYKLTVTKPTGGTVTTDPAGGISCGTGGTDCTENYKPVTPATPVTLNATPDDGYGIGTWTGCTASPDKTTCTVTMTAAKTAKVTFLSYNLTVKKAGTGTGTVTNDPTGPSCGTNCMKYPPSTSVTLTAAADPDSTITGWTGCTASSDKTTCTVAMTAAKTATVTFTTYKLTVTKPTGGTVTTEPAGGISCGTGGTDCTENYKPVTPATPVTLNATPDDGYGIGTWTGCTASPDKTTCTVTMTAAKTAKVIFLSYNLTVKKAGTGTGTVTNDPTGPSCGTNCMKYPPSTSVTLTAAADPDSTITGWTGCTASSDKTTCTVAMTAAKTATVTFTTYKLTVTKPTGGTVTTDPAGGISCGTGGTDCTENYKPVTPATPVTLNATPDDGYGIGTWTGCTASPDKTTCTVTMTAAKTAKVIFLSYNLTVKKAGTGTGTVTNDPTGPSCGTNCMKYPPSTSVTLTAAADPDSTITGWTGCTASSDKTTCTVAMTAAKTVKVTFSLK